MMTVIHTMTVCSGHA